MWSTIWAPRKPSRLGSASWSGAEVDEDPLWGENLQAEADRGATSLGSCGHREGVWGWGFPGDLCGRHAHRSETWTCTSSIGAGCKDVDLQSYGSCNWGEDGEVLWLGDHQEREGLLGGSNGLCYMELVKKHGIEQPWHPGQTLFSNLGTEDGTVVDPKGLKACQGIIGELQWLQKSRPDVCYHVGVMSRLMHRRPKTVLKLGKELMRYLAGTVNNGLHYVRCEEQPPFGEGEQLPERRSISQLEVYTDSSFALEHELHKSVTGMTVYLGGAPVLWLSGRQPFVTSSTTEAELLSCGEGFQAAEGLGALLQAMGFKDIAKVLLCDSKSGLQLMTTETGSWRTRHLRIRHAKLREAIQEGEQPVWKARHVPGAGLVADGLTKALQGLRFMEFVRGLKMFDMKAKEVTPAVEMGDEFGNNPAESQAKVEALMMAGAKLAEPRDNPPKARMAGVALLVAGICWMKRNGRWEQVYELSPPLTSREDEPGCVEKQGPVVRAPNEPTTQEERGRENEPPQVNLAAVRAQNEPTVGRDREDKPPKKDPEGHQEKGIGGFPKVQTNLELLKPTVELSFEMLPQKEGISVVPVGQHCAAEFGRPPIGRADHWLMRGEWMVRAHGKSRLAFALEDSFATWRASTWLRGGEVLWGKTWTGDPEPKMAVVCGQGQGSLAWIHLFPTQDDKVSWEFLRCCAYSAGPTYTGWGAFSGCAINAWGHDEIYGKWIAISAWAIAELEGISWVPPSKCGGERPTGRWETFAPWSGWCRGRSNQRLERSVLRPWGDPARCEGGEGSEAWRYAIWPWSWKRGEGKVHSWTDWWRTSDAGWCWGACWRKVWTSLWASTWHLELFKPKRNKWNRELKYLHFWAIFRVWNGNYIGDYLNAGDDFNRWDNWVLWTWPGWGSQQWQQPRPYVATKDAGHQRRGLWKGWIWTGASWPFS